MASVPVAMTVYDDRLICFNAFLYRGDAICEACVGASPWFAPDLMPRLGRQALACLREGAALDEDGGTARVAWAERFAPDRNREGRSAASARASRLTSLAETRHA